MASQLHRVPISASRDESSAEFAGFYREYFPRLEAHLRLRLHASDAEEAAQETLVRVFQRWDHLDMTRDPWPLVFVIARNILTDVHRRERAGHSAEAAAGQIREELAESPEELFLHDEQAHLVHEAMDALRPADRRVLNLKLFRGLSCAEIAELLGCSVVSVRQRLSRARKRMLTQVERLGGVVIPAVGWLVAWTQHLRRQLAGTSAAAPVTAGAVVLAVGTGILGPSIPHDDGPQAVAQPPAAGVSAPTISPAAETESTDQSPARPDAEAPAEAPLRKPPEQTNPSLPVTPTPPSEPSDAPAVPVRHSASASPGTGPGPKASHSVEVPTPLGTVIVKGETSTDGPVLDPLCQNGVDACD